MSWYSKVAWKEGLFLQPHHLQQADRYQEKLIEARTRKAGTAQQRGDAARMRDALAEKAAEQAAPERIEAL